MFRKILYPTDFSEATRKATQFIKKLKEAGTEEVVILHVIDDRTIHSLERYTAQYADVSLVVQDIKEKALQAVNPIEEELRESGFKVKIRVEHGIPFSQILKVEEEENVSLTVIGSHGKSNIGSMLLGSVSEKVIRKSKKPVIVIKRENAGL
ncbi:MAG: universal stress protein [Deltaproteobacteria bacterium]|nr:universal stress protein [Deltaproteobacteria bacterium]